MSLTKIRLREAWNWGGLSAKELAVRTWKAMDRHETLDRAAAVAFWTMLALAPFLSFVLVSALGWATTVAHELRDLSGRLLPGEADAIVRSQIEKIQKAQPVGVLSVSFVVLLWSASSIFVGIMDATNAAYEIRDARPFWKRRLLAAVLTVVEAVLLVGASATIVAWPYLTEWLHLNERLGFLASTLATAVQWLVVIVALLASFSIAYYFAPHVEQEWEWITPGSGIGCLILILASLGFRVYLIFGTSYSETYGALAGAILLLLWLYLASLTLLVGAEINSVIEHAAPHGKAPGQKTMPQHA